MHMHVETMNMVAWMTTERECKCMFVHHRALIHVKLMSELSCILVWIDEIGTRTLQRCRYR